MIETQSKTINGIEFRTNQFAALRATPLLIRLVKAVGPALAALRGMMQAEVSIAGLGPALGDALGALDPDDATRLIQDLLKSTKAIVDDKVVELNSENAINKVFSGKDSLQTMFEVVGFVVEVNFSGFFAGGSEPAAAPSPTPLT